MYSPKEGGGRSSACWLASLLGGGWAQWSTGEVEQGQQQQQEWQQSALKHNEITLDILSIKYG